MKIKHRPEYWYYWQIGKSSVSNNHVGTESSMPTKMAAERRRPSGACVAGSASSGKDGSDEQTPLSHPPRPTAAELWASPWNGEAARSRAGVASHLPLGGSWTGRAGRVGRAAITPSSSSPKASGVDRGRAVARRVLPPLKKKNQPSTIYWHLIVLRCPNCSVRI